MLLRSVEIELIWRTLPLFHQIEKNDRSETNPDERQFRNYSKTKYFMLQILSVGIFSSVFKCTYLARIQSTHCLPLVVYTFVASRHWTVEPCVDFYTTWPLLVLYLHQTFNYL